MLPKYSPWEVKSPIRTRPEENDIIASKIIARATVRHGHGNFVTIICAFQLSNEFHFWFVFRARSPRTARKNWRLMYKIGVHGYTRDKKTNLGEAVARAASNDTAAKITKRFPAGKRNFDANFDRVCYPFKYKPSQPSAPISTEYINRKFAAGRRGLFTVGKR